MALEPKNYMVVKYGGKYKYSVQLREGFVPFGACAIVNGCLGHSSPEDAYAHHKEYLISQAKLTLFSLPSKLDKCCVFGCKKHVEGIMQITPTKVLKVCSKHFHGDVMRKLFNVGPSDEPL